jgi:hypothetical protein
MPRIRIGRGHVSRVHRPQLFSNFAFAGRAYLDFLCADVSVSPPEQEAHQNSATFLFSGGLKKPGFLYRSCGLPQYGQLGDGSDHEVSFSESQRFQIKEPSSPHVS